MRLSGSLLLAPLLLLGTVGAQARDWSPEAELARALEGRVAGPPVHCLALGDIRSSRIIDGVAILYEAAGGTIYVNRPKDAGNMLRRDDVLVTDTHTSQLCNVDVVKLYDNATRMQDGFVLLDDFIPYRKPG